MAFIKLTHKNTGRGIYFNTLNIDSIEPDISGSHVKSGSLVVHVEENHLEVLDIINGKVKTQKEGKVDGNKKSIQSSKETEWGEDDL